VRGPEKIREGVSVPQSRLEDKKKGRGGKTCLAPEPLEEKKKEDFREGFFCFLTRVTGRLYRESGGPMSLGVRVRLGVMIRCRLKKKKWKGPMPVTTGTHKLKRLWGCVIGWWGICEKGRDRKGA